MADIIMSLDGSTQEPPIKFVDLGSGTYAMQVVAVRKDGNDISGGAGGGGDATAANQVTQSNLLNDLKSAIGALTDNQTGVSDSGSVIAKLRLAVNLLNLLCGYTDGVESVLNQINGKFGSGPQVSTQSLSVVDGEYSFVRLLASAQVKGSTGGVKRIVVTKKGTGGSFCRILNSTTATGTVLAEIDTDTFLGEMPFDAWMTTGIYVVLGGTTPPEVTVMYR